MKDATYAVESISDLLRVPFGESTLTRLDFGSNFVMNHDLSLYQNCILSASRLKRVDRDDTVYLVNGQQQLAFYNKYKEAKDKSIIIPEEYNFETLYRYEFRFLKGRKIKSSLHCENPTVSLLDDSNS